MVAKVKAPKAPKAPQTKPTQEPQGPGVPPKLKGGIDIYLAHQKVLAKQAEAQWELIPQPKSETPQVKTVTQSSYNKTVVITETITPPVTTYHPEKVLEVGESPNLLEVEEGENSLRLGSKPRSTIYERVLTR